MPERPIVIVGSGLAGYTAAREFRKHDRETPLLLVTADDGRSYYKPDLSEALGKDRSPDDLVRASPEEMGEKLGVAVRTRTRVEAIDPDAGRIRTEGGDLDYGALVLGIGAEPIDLPIAGRGPDVPMHVNDLADYERFRSALAGVERVTIIGAGLVGCEFANDLCAAGLAVDVVDPTPWPLPRLLPEPAGDALREGLAGAGVRWHLGRQVERLETHPAGVRVHLDDGATLDAHLALSAVGLRPRTALAADAGIDVGRGIRADRWLETSAPGVYALGDCAEVEGHVLPFVLPLTHAARALGRTLAGERTAVRYPGLPVSVKTHAHPVSAAPPAEGAEGEWRVERGEDGVRAVFRGPDGTVRGFALTGPHVRDTGKLARELPPVIG